MKLSILIPVYNEEKTILPLLKKVEEVSLPGIEKEIIVINDASTDATEAKIKAYHAGRKHIKVLTHGKNQGKGAAIQTGIHQASGEYIIIQDADLEYDPSDMKKLLQPILEKRAEIVYGTRLRRMPRLRKEENRPRFFLHYIGNRFLSLITSLLYGQWLTDMETCYKIFPRKAVEKIRLQSKRFDFEPEITAKLLKKGYKIREIPITTTPRGYEEGKKLHTLRDGCIAFWTLVKYRFIS